MGLPTPPGLFGSREARALNQAAPAFDLRRQEFLQLGRRRAVDRDGANPDDHVANLRRCGLEFGVQPIDPPTYAIALAALAGIAVAACAVPALRATRVDPLVALRDE